jgi:hypothetical protein
MALSSLRTITVPVVTEEGWHTIETEPGLVRLAVPDNGIAISCTPEAVREFVVLPRLYE